MYHSTLPPHICTYCLICGTINKTGELYLAPPLLLPQQFQGDNRQHQLSIEKSLKSLIACLVASTNMDIEGIISHTKLSQYDVILGLLQIHTT